MKPLSDTELTQMARNVVRKFAGRFPPGVTTEDAEQDATLLLLEWQGKKPDRAHLFMKVLGVLRDRYGRSWRQEYAHQSVPLEDAAVERDRDAEQVRMDVRDAIDKLPEREREAMTLYLTGMTQAAIAGQMRCSQPYVSQLMASAREKLGSTLSEAYA